MNTTSTHSVPAAHAALHISTLSILMLWGLGDAQAQGFDIQNLNPMPGQDTHFISQPSAQPHFERVWEVGLLANYADDPLVLVDQDGNRVSSVVSGQLPINLLFFAAPFWWLELGLDIPLIAFQSGEDIPQLADVDGSQGGFGLGDIRIIPKVVLYTQEEADDPTGFSLALLSDFFLPTGDGNTFQGEGFRWLPRLVGDYKTDRGYRISANLGYALRDEVQLRNVDIDDALRLGIAMGVPVGDSFEVVPELIGGYGLFIPEVDIEESPVEFVLGGKYRGIENVMMEAGAGVGVIPGVGTPDWRVLLGVSYQFASTPAEEDYDGDGLVGAADECPQNPEDFDTFQDTDGCPDPDNDRDGILDINDTCPMTPEDRDGVEDEDGCPEDDEKPTVQEPKDTDGDGILDRDDACPKDPEDKDDFEDKDGCPDPDNDKDGILDVNDKCPLVPETVNGVDDEDGCPDKGLVEMNCDKIDLKDRVYFKTAKADIQTRSFALLDTVVALMKSRTGLRKVLVEGHTDDVGSDKANQKLSDARSASVRKYLIDKGIDASRITNKGFGESKPAKSIKGLRGKALRDARSSNRRVEFIILEDDSCKK